MRRSARRRLPACLHPVAPAEAVPAGEYRALTVHDIVPDGCGTVPVPDEAFAPHLKAGELAVIDPEDREPSAGEIFAVKITSVREPCGYVLRFTQLRTIVVSLGIPDGAGGWRPGPEGPAWMMHFQLIRPRPMPRFYRTMEDALANVSSWTLSEGPLRTESMRSMIVGRVVGVMLEAA